MWQVESEATNCCSGSAPGVQAAVLGIFQGAALPGSSDAVAEVDAVRARIGLVLELALQLPLHGCAVFRHGRLTS